ncbi:hypothetical protein [Streptomyces lavendulocolor]
MIRVVLLLQDGTQAQVAGAGGTRMLSGAEPGALSPKRSSGFR